MVVVSLLYDAILIVDSYFQRFGFVNRGMIYLCY